MKEFLPMEDSEQTLIFQPMVHPSNVLMLSIPIPFQCWLKLKTTVLVVSVVICILKKKCVKQKKKTYMFDIRR